MVVGSIGVGDNLEMVVYCNDGVLASNFTVSGAGTNVKNYSTVESGSNGDECSVMIVAEWDSGNSVTYL